MAKYVCPACKKILIRSADDIRLSGSTSYCEETDKSVKLTRLKLGKPQSKRPAFDSDIADRWLARRLQRVLKKSFRPANSDLSG